MDNDPDTGADYIMTERGWKKIFQKRNVCPAPRDPTLLEEVGIHNPRESGDQYSQAVQRYIAGDLSHNDLARVLSAKNKVYLPPATKHILKLKE